MTSEKHQKWGSYRKKLYETLIDPAIGTGSPLPLTALQPSALFLPYSTDHREIQHCITTISFFTSVLACTLQLNKLRKR